MSEKSIQELHQEKSDAQRRFDEAMAAMDNILRPVCIKAIEEYNQSPSIPYRIKVEGFDIALGGEDWKTVNLSVQLLDRRDSEPDEDFWSDTDSISALLKPFADQRFSEAGIDASLGFIRIPASYYPK